MAVVQLILDRLKDQVRLRATARAAASPQTRLNTAGTSLVTQQALVELDMFRCQSLEHSFSRLIPGLQLSPEAKAELWQAVNAGFYAGCPSAEGSHEEVSYTTTKLHVTEAALVESRQYFALAHAVSKRSQQPASRSRPLTAQRHLTATALETIRSLPAPLNDKCSSILVAMGQHCATTRPTRAMLNAAAACAHVLLRENDQLMATYLQYFTLAAASVGCLGARGSTELQPLEEQHKGMESGALSQSASFAHLGRPKRCATLTPTSNSPVGGNTGHRAQRALLGNAAGLEISSFGAFSAKSLKGPSAELNSAMLVGSSSGEGVKSVSDVHQGGLIFPTVRGSKPQSRANSTWPGHRVNTERPNSSLDKLDQGMWQSMMETPAGKVDAATVVVAHAPKRSSLILESLAPMTKPKCLPDLPSQHQRFGTHPSMVVR